MSSERKEEEEKNIRTGANEFQSTKQISNPKINMKLVSLLLLIVSIHALLIPSQTAQTDHGGGESSIVFTTLGRLDYSFDIFAIPTNQPPKISGEIQITDGKSVNFNGHFPSPSPSPTPNQTLPHLVYVTERQGVSNIYYDSVSDLPNRLQIPLLTSDLISMKDRPSISGDQLIYVSTHQNSGEPRTSWTAVYSTDLKPGGETRRLTPHGIADFSPAVSPSGNLTAVASYGARGWDGDVEELSTDIYVFLTRDGTRRVKAVEHGGWPCWSDDSTLFFHRRGPDRWWSVYQATLPKGVPISADSVKIRRVTPPGLHAFTPAASPGNKSLIAVATRRPGSSYRHVELFDLERGEFMEITRHVAPETHHFNPFLSPDLSLVGYHKCNNKKPRGESPKLFLQNLPSPLPEVSLFRLDGSFPSISPAGDRVAFVDFPGLFVANLDGSNQRQIYGGNAFSTSWDPVGRDVVYAGAGPEFAPVSAEVDIISVSLEDLVVKKLTSNGKNNAFPSPSPDGKRIVFRSGRTGNKNLYIMGSESGEGGGLERLTEGDWTDTMCNWSPDGDWVAFSSDRHNPGGGSFGIYLIHPNGTGLRRLVESGLGGRANHPWFSPDGKRLVFTTDYSGVSAEPISNPHHYQPYGEIFTVNLDGSGLTRLTHNSYEDGTPVWAPKFIRPVDAAWPVDQPQCQFEDLHWLNEMGDQNMARSCAKFSY